MNIEVYDLNYIIPLEILTSVVLCLSIKKYFNNQRGISYFLFWLIISLFCTFYCWGYDYNSYIARFEYVTPSTVSDYLEPFYSWLIINVTHSYLSWRFVVWGLATFLVTLTFKRLNVDKNVAFFLFIAIPLYQTFFILRQSLAFAVILFGLSILYVPLSKRKYLNFCLAFGVICGSYFFHKSMPLYIALSMAVLIVPFTKRNILISVLLFPVLHYLISRYSAALLGFNFFTEQAIDAGNMYLESDYSQNLTTLGWIQTIIQRLPIFLILYYAYFKMDQDSIKYKGYLSFCFACVYISMLLYNQPFSGHLSLRFWASALLPIVIFVSGNIEKLLQSRFVKSTTALIVFSYLWNILYNVYFIIK